MLVGLIFLALFPKSTAHPVSLLGLRYFNEREAQILTQRVLRDDPTKFQPRRNVSLAEVKAAVRIFLPLSRFRWEHPQLTGIRLQFSNWRILPHCLTTILGMAPAQALGAYAPSLVVSFGFDRLKSNAMISIGSWITFLMNIVFGFGADWTGYRGLWVLGGVLLSWGFTLGDRLVIGSGNRDLRFALLIMTVGFSSPWRKHQPILQ